jgi:hypothetical protein
LLCFYFHKPDTPTSFSPPSRAPARATGDYPLFPLRLFPSRGAPFTGAAGRGSAEGLHPLRPYPPYWAGLSGPQPHPSPSSPEWGRNRGGFNPRWVGLLPPPCGRKGGSRPLLSLSGRPPRGRARAYSAPLDPPEGSPPGAGFRLGRYPALPLPPSSSGGGGTPGGLDPRVASGDALSRPRVGRPSPRAGGRPREARRAPPGPLPKKRKGGFKKRGLLYL